MVRVRLPGNVRSNLARADHLALLEERLFFPTRAGYAWHLLGYQRTRILSGEDLVLSRPLFDAYHAVLEGLLEVDALERGMLGIAVHSATVLAVFAFARRWLPLGLAFLAGLAIASPLPGVDLVIWRHAAPYGLAVCFLALAAAELCARPPSRAKVLTWLTLSALAHETMVAVLVVAAGATLAITGERKRTWALWTVGPLAMCAVVYALHALAFPLGWSASGSSGGATLAGLAWIPRVLGLAALAWAAPWTTGVALDPWARAVVSMHRSAGSDRADRRRSPVAGRRRRTCPRPAFVREARNDRRRTWRYWSAATCSRAWCSSASVGSARAGPAYLASSGYYFQIWAVCFEVLAVLAVGVRLRDRGRAPVAVGLLVVGSLSSVSAAAIVGPLLLGQRDLVRAAHDIEDAIRDAIDREPTWCFAGVADDRARSLFAPATPFAPLGRRVCSVHPEREPVVLATTDGHLALVPLVLPIAGPGSGPSGFVSVRVERGTGVILQLQGAPSVGVAYVGHEIHVQRDGRELTDQTDVVPVADASGAHTMALAVVERAGPRDVRRHARERPRHRFVARRRGVNRRDGSHAQDNRTGPPLGRRAHTRVRARGASRRAARGGFPPLRLSRSCVPSSR